MTATDRYFVIFGTMRSGSNLLEKTLGSLPDVAVHGEIFNPGFISRPRCRDLAGWQMDARDADPPGFLRDVRALEPERITGLRLFNGHSRVALAHTLADPDCRRIILKRDPVECWISLAIARETDQWILSNPRRRVTATVRFEPDAFEDFRDAWRAHYAWMNDQMARAGTSAMRVDYADLKDPEALGRLTRHIGSAHLPAETAPIHRQNPEPMSAKVINYPEMIAYFGGERPGWTAPPPPPVTGDELLASRHVPLAFAPIEGAAGLAGAVLMQRLEARRTDGIDEPFGTFADRMASGALFARGTGAPAGERQAFTLVCHPALRAHAAFREHVFGKGWRDSPVRRLIQEQVGPLPTAHVFARSPGAAEIRALFPPERQAEAFAAYVDLIETVMAGQSPLRPGPEWISQTELLQHWRALIPDLMVARLDDFADLARQLAVGLGIDPLPPGKLYSVRMAGYMPQLPASQALGDGTADRLARLYSEDYAAFNYTALTAEMEDPRAG